MHQYIAISYKIIVIAFYFNIVNCFGMLFENRTCNML